MILNLVHWPAGGWEPDKERTPSKSASGASLGKKSDLQDRPELLAEQAREAKRCLQEDQLCVRRNHLDLCLTGIDSSDVDAVID